MSTSLGTTSVATQALNNLVSGPVEVMDLPCDSLVSKQIGQVLEYDFSADNFINAATYVQAKRYAIFADRVLHASAGTLDADTVCTLIVAGKVNTSSLDATSAADAGIQATLLGSGIFAQKGVAA